MDGVVAVGDIGPATDWSRALQDAECVVHCAARVHLMNDRAADPLEAYFAVNVQGTLNLARQAAAAGVRRFVFLSSIKVNGEATEPGFPFAADDAPNPHGPYAVSKAAAEDGLRALAAKTGVECVIVRPPLVYGPGVRANFAAIVRAVSRGLPLPFGSIDGNRRSLVGLDNLVDLLVTCIDHPSAANQIFLASDGEDLSTTSLLHRLGEAIGKPPRLLPVPSAILALAASLTGKGEAAKRVLGNLQVDIGKTRRLLGWQPPVSVDDGLRRVILGA